MGPPPHKPPFPPPSPIGHAPENKVQDTQVEKIKKCDVRKPIFVYIKLINYKRNKIDASLNYKLLLLLLLGRRRKRRSLSRVVETCY